MRDFSQDHRWLSINTATVRKSRGVDLPLPEIIEACVRRGIRAISPWRDQVHAAGLANISQLVRTHGLELSGYCRGGMFPAADAAGLKAARDDNRRAVDEAAELRAPCVVLVVGGLPGALQGKAAHKDIALARTQVRDGIAEHAGVCEAGADAARDRAAASDVCGRPGLRQHAGAGAGPLRRARSAGARARSASRSTSTTCGGTRSCEEQIARAGRERLLAFHVCDWLTPTTDLLNDRGMMGDGVIDIPRIRGWVEAQGFAGYSEVEIFSTGNWWQRPHEEMLDTCIARHQSVV